MNTYILILVQIINLKLGLNILNYDFENYKSEILRIFLSLTSKKSNNNFSKA